MKLLKDKKVIRILITIILLIIGIVKPFNELVNSIISIITYLLIGYDVIMNAFKNIIKGKLFDENFLMTIATFGAIILSEYLEAVAIMLFYQIGEYFLDYSVENSKKSISSLMNLRPDYANLVIDNEIKKVSPNDVKINDIIIVKPGEKIPLDGKIIEGKTSLNTSSITGESMPKDVEIGDNVISGCINLKGVIKIEVLKEYKESTVSKIIDLMENSSEQKSKTENFVTKFAKYYTPIVIILAALLTVIPVLVLNDDFGLWFERSLVFLVISCPCALAVSIPLGFFGGIASCSNNGILVKGGNHIETLDKTKTMVFDKTGTLTKGNFIVSAVHPDKISENKLLEYAALSEYYSQHPISISIKNSYKGILDKNRIKEIEEISGKGIYAKIDDKEIYIGNQKLMDYIGVKWRECELVGTIVHIAIDKEYMGHIIITDEIKEDAYKTINLLKESGVNKIIMLTGDSNEVANIVAKKLEINKFYSDLLPNDKVEHLKNFMKDKSKKEKLAFVGDGINDAPALALADVGISMGKLGSDAAIEAADIVIMDDMPIKLPLAKKIAKKTMDIVRENIVLAISIKVIVLFLGSIGFANMWEAVFADVGVTIIAVINSLRTLTIKNKYF